MAESGARKAATTRKRPTANRKATKRKARPRMLVDDVTAILGFGYVISFRDPDGNHVSVIEYGPEYW